MDRRNFIRNTAVAAGGLALGPTFWSSLYGTASAAEARAASITHANPYGKLGPADANGIRLPEGFSSRVVAVSGETVGDTLHPWHYSPDGGACFKVPGGGGRYVYVSNAEVGFGGGGVGAIRFAGDGAVEAAYSILAGTNRNCAGGPTPWGTWLSAEEVVDGTVWECDPFQASQGTDRPAMGIFNHEAAAVDPKNKHVYLTEDHPEGRLYRFIPASYPDLSTGKLQVAKLVRNDSLVPVATNVSSAQVRWVTVSDGPVGASSPRPANSTAFTGGEGIWFDSGSIYFTTKGDNRVWRYVIGKKKMTVIYDDALFATPPLRGVDNVVVSRGGEIVVAEDGDNMEIQVIRLGSPRTVGSLLRIVDQPGSEITGPAFNPRGNRLYFSSQRATGSSVLGGHGITYEVTGPFLGAI